MTEGKKCSVCGETLVAQEEIPVKDHTEETVAGKDATCTETGLTEGSHCGACGEVLVAQQIIPVLVGYSISYEISNGDSYLATQTINIITLLAAAT